MAPAMACATDRHWFESKRFDAYGILEIAISSRSYTFNVAQLHAIRSVFAFVSAPARGPSARNRNSNKLKQHRGALFAFIC